ncbi:hypothetical protein JCM10914A_39990 [Paenibacillus sp. JCM 10914]|uniref:hypothetical protein n=1 Tax=Paenibacillus sp. JCM 10914 TaxID=1236974 RepID=UPI0003CC62C8|nr:hypothetical protein [Paenibacillus sp. JCM 10914]GAE04725.1 hypothetical protein JCM10914_781 [Paenibacillus sp. JCM 10914]
MNRDHHDEMQRIQMFIRGEGTTAERSEFEERLLHDDYVLELYMQVLAEVDHELPELQDPETFAAELVEHEDIQPYRSNVTTLSPQRSKRWYERPMFHYTIAASITLLFMFTGAFDRLLPAEIEQVVAVKEAPSYSEQLMQKTTGWLDQLLSK